MPRIGIPELVIILVVILIIFGAGKLPQVGGAMGKAMREFRRGRTDVDEVAEEEKPKSKKAAKKATGG